MPTSSLWSLCGSVGVQELDKRWSILHPNLFCVCQGHVVCCFSPWILVLTLVIDELFLLWGESQAWRRLWNSSAVVLSGVKKQSLTPFPFKQKDANSTLQKQVEKQFLNVGSIRVYTSAMCWNFYKCVGGVRLLKFQQVIGRSEMETIRLIKSELGRLGET